MRVYRFVLPDYFNLPSVLENNTPLSCLDQYAVFLTVGVTEPKKVVDVLDSFGANKQCQVQILVYFLLGEQLVIYLESGGSVKPTNNVDVLLGNSDKQVYREVIDKFLHVLSIDPDYSYYLHWVLDSQISERFC